MTESEFFTQYQSIYEDISATLDYTAGVDLDLLRGQPIIILVDGTVKDANVQSINPVTKEVHYTLINGTNGTQSYLSEWIFMRLFKKGLMYEGQGSRPSHVKSTSCECGSAFTSNKKWHMTYCPLSGVRR